MPIATQLAKLAMLELLADKSSTLNVLKRDFDAPWYLWLNRREPGTQYADLPPLSESRDEMTINRWYGIYFERDEQWSDPGHSEATPRPLRLDQAHVPGLFSIDGYIDVSAWTPAKTAEAIVQRLRSNEPSGRETA